MSRIVLAIATLMLTAPEPNNSAAQEHSIAFLKGGVFWLVPDNVEVASESNLRASLKSSREEFLEMAQNVCSATKEQTEKLRKAATADGLRLIRKFEELASSEEHKHSAKSLLALKTLHRRVLFGEETLGKRLLPVVLTSRQQTLLVQHVFKDALEQGHQGCSISEEAKEALETALVNHIDKYKIAKGELATQSGIIRSTIRELKKELPEYSPLRSELQSFYAALLKR